VPDLAPSSPAAGEPSAGGWAQARLFELLLGFLGRLAARSPVVCVIEDLHWADEATRGLVAFLVHNLADERLLLVATVRSDDLHRRHPLMPLLAELRRSPRVERIDLAPFDRNELARQLAAILGHEPEPSLVAEIEARSEGNAYLAEELAAVGPSARLPDTLEEVLLARVGRLGPAAQEALRVASAAGPRIDTEILAAVARQLYGESAAAIRELVDEHVLIRDGDEAEERFAFRHALLQEAVYGQLLPGERIRYHEAFARALSERGDRRDPSAAAELAHHFEAAHDLPRALVASVDAGRAAETVNAFADAQRLFERALAIWDRVPDAAERAGVDRPSLLELTAAAASAAGASVRAALHLRAAIELVDGDGDPVRAGLLNEHLGRYAWDAGQPLESLAAAREAVRLVPPEPPTAARARVLGGLARTLLFTVSAEEGADIAREAIAAATGIGAPDVEADALVTLSMALSDCGAVGDAASALRHARDMAIEIGDDYVALRAWSSLLATLNVAADLGSSATEGAAAAAWAEEHGRMWQSGAVLMFNYGHALYQLGRWDEAERLVRRVNLGTHPGEYALLVPMALIHLEIGRGDMATAARRLESARGVVGRGDAWERVVIANLAAQIALAGGDLREGRRLAEAGLPELPMLGRWDTNIYCYILLTAVRVEAEVAERARARRAERELDEATARGGRIVHEARSITASIVTDCPELRRRPAAVLALCEAEWSRIQGQPDVGLWADAAAACEVAQQLHLRPYALYRQAEAMLADKADRGEVAAVLREAHASVVAMGARPLQGEIEALAERGRIRLEPDAGASGGRDAGDTATDSASA
jgi:tetratricopeptide (TPR) repeat protein